MTLTVHTVATICFLCGAAVLFYVLFGYPVLLWLLTRGKPPAPVRSAAEPPDGTEWPTVSVLLPVRNGEAWIDAKLACLRALDYPQDRIQIIVIDDRSTDQSRDIVRTSPYRAELLEQPHSAGKAVALTRALEYATGELLFLTDVRQHIAPDALRALVAQFRDQKVGVATGELIILSKEGTEEENVGLYWKFEKWMRKRHSAIDSVLGATGAIYVIRRDLAEPLPPGTLLDDMLMPLRAFLRGYRIVFVPEALAYDRGVDVKGEFPRKVRTQAGVYQLVGLCPALLGPGNRMWFHFVSHKLGRLMLPWALLVMLLASPFLPFPWNALLLAGQLGFYALALLDPVIPPSPLRRLSSVIRTFAVMMWAAMCAVRIFFVPASSLWQATPDKQQAGRGAPAR